MDLQYLRALCGTWWLTEFCALKSLCRHADINEHFALPHTAMVMGFIAPYPRILTWEIISGGM